jgi:hypothetical protein
MFTNHSFLLSNHLLVFNAFLRNALFQIFLAFLRFYLSSHLLSNSGEMQVQFILEFSLFLPSLDFKRKCAKEG